jgi:hypothetical protein
MFLVIRGLATFDAVTFLPIYYALFMVCGVLFGSLFYQVDPHPVNLNNDIVFTHLSLVGV